MPLSCYKFGEFELNCARFELRRNGQILKLERIPMELLILLAEKDGNVVTRQEIIERLWGKDVFVDTEHGINTAIRKIRTVLREDAERPRFVQTVLGKGYRFVAEPKNGYERPTEVAQGTIRAAPDLAAPTLIAPALVPPARPPRQRLVGGGRWRLRPSRSAYSPPQYWDLIPEEFAGASFPASREPKSNRSQCFR